MKRILVEEGFSQTRVALAKDGELLEFSVDIAGEESNVGNIYCARVQSVLLGMQAAFVDIGDRKNAYLPFLKGEKPKTGDEFLVQVEKAASGQKGAIVTRKLSFPGKYMVLLPEDSEIGISKKIADTEEKRRLRDLAAELLPEGFGLILRTEASGRDSESLRQEFYRLYARAEKVLAFGGYQKAPALIHKDCSAALLAVRELFTDDVCELITNQEETYQALVHEVQFWGLDESRISFYQDKLPLFDAYGIETQIEKAFSKHVWLKSGGFLMIEQTEACVVIDVNTGKYTGKKNLEKTFLKTNLEAAVEIAKQLRLRNLSGMIIVDFIDMREQEHKKLLEETLKQAVAGDRVKTIVVGMTELGLMQMTRKKKRPSTVSALTVKCRCCDGTGRVLSLSYLVQKMQREVTAILCKTAFDQVTVIADSRLLAAFCGQDGEFLKKAAGLGKTVLLAPSPDALYGQYEIKKEMSSHNPDSSKTKLS